MRRRVARIARLSLLLLCTWLATAIQLAAETTPSALTGTVTWVYDADTLKVEPHGQVRLIGIDAPEKSASDRDLAFVRLGIAPGRLRPVHGEGLAWAIHNVKGQPVTLRFDRTRRDRHGRLLAYVHLADGRLVNRLLLETGLAVVYRRFPFALKEEFLSAEAQARQRGIGLWTQ